ncbi:MAG: hypothetical protein ABFD91_11225 [Anaerohalosphaeraceae bacterium]
MYSRGIGSVLLFIILFCPVYAGGLSKCLTGDCEEDLEDLGVLAGQWLTISDSCKVVTSPFFDQYTAT